MQRFNTKSFFDGDLPKHPDESENLLSEFGTKVPEDLYEQFEQEQISENKDKVSSFGDPGNDFNVKKINKGARLVHMTKSRRPNFG